MHYVADDRGLVSHYSGLIAAEPAVATTGAGPALAHTTHTYVFSLQNYFRMILLEILLLILARM